MRLFSFLAIGSSFASASVLATRNETTDLAVQQIQNQTNLPLPDCAVRFPYLNLPLLDEHADRGTQQGRCFVQVLPEYNCAPDDISCICPNANLTSALSACFTSNCTIPEHLLAEKFSKVTCGAVRRDESTTTRSLTWALFAIALVFVGARFLARPQRLQGSGYGTDDWTILHCLILLIPINVLVQTMTDNGLGTDNYQVSAPRITAMLQVSSRGVVVDRTLWYEVWLMRYLKTDLPPPPSSNSSFLPFFTPLWS